MGFFYHVKRADEAGADVSLEYAIISGAVRLIVLHSSALPARMTREIVRCLF